jgi:hypothetical protein
VQGTRDAAGVFRIAAQGTYCGFQLGSRRCAVGGTFGEQGFEFWVLDVFSAKPFGRRCWFRSGR